MTHDQLFFLNYAQIWCGTNRPEDALTKIRSSVHSPGRLRVLGPLSNSVDFARAYNCPPGSPMNPTSKCSVWWTFTWGHQVLSVHKRKNHAVDYLNFIELSPKRAPLFFDVTYRIFSNRILLSSCNISKNTPLNPYIIKQLNWETVYQLKNLRKFGPIGINLSVSATPKIIYPSMIKIRKCVWPKWIGSCKNR